MYPDELADSLEFVQRSVHFMSLYCIYEYLCVYICVVYMYFLYIYIALYCTSCILQYIPQANILFVLFENRCFLHLNPEKGNKRIKIKGKKHIINPKVLSLANQLKDYESEWSLCGI